MDNLQSRVLVASQTLNDLTGYSAIEQIKAENTRLEQALASAQAHLRDARRDYQQLTTERAATQREVTTLLARKDSWTPADLERFTALYRHDHSADRRVAEAAAALTEAEAEEARLSAALTNGILRRYHEEQVWSDRIRRQSTWGTWGLMGVNVLLFIAFQFVAEPWKRARLVRGVAEREREVLDEVRRELAEVRGALEASERSRAGEREQEVETTATVVAAPAETLSPVVIEEPKQPQIATWKELLSDPSKWAAAVSDLYSDRRIALRMRDASLLALEGAAAGLVFAFGVFFTFFRRT
jgi:sensitive to high expression protein 9, mitochondrial